MEHTKSDCNCWDIFVSMKHGLECGNCGAVEQKNDSYTYGYNAGKAARLLNIKAAIMALHSTNEQYAVGYKDGYFFNSKN